MKSINTLQDLAVWQLEKEREIILSYEEKEINLTEAITCLSEVHKAIEIIANNIQKKLDNLLN